MLSIIILNYNTFDLTCKCIESIVALTTITHEIILVDNASSECNPKLFKEKFPFIKLVCNKENEGFSKGNNSGIKHAQGDYILLLNSDTLLINNAIDLAYGRIIQDPEIGALTVQLKSPNGDLQNCSYYNYSLKQVWGCALKLHHLFPELRPKTPDLLSEHFSDALYGTFFLFPKKILGHFPENKLTETFFMYVEDAEWCHYIQKSGYKLLYYPPAQVLHYGGGSSDHHDFGNWKNRLENEYILIKLIKGKRHVNCYFLGRILFYLSQPNKKSWLTIVSLFKTITYNLFK